MAPDAINVDKPKPNRKANDIAREILEHFYFPLDFEKADDVIRLFDSAGLKIVEK